MTSAKTNTQAPSLDSNRQALTSTPPVSAATSNTTASPSQPQSSKEEPLQGSSTAGDGAPGRNSRPQQPLLPTERGATASGAKLGIGSTEDAHVRVDGGWVVLRVVPDDNSCLFTALSICLEHGRTNAIQKLRQTVADTIRDDPFTWSEAVLGMEPEQYRQRILKKTTWGGAIELAILSQVYSTEIDSVDVQSGRVDRFGEEHQYPSQIFLIYSGIHYDAVTFTPLEPERSSVYPYDLGFDQTVFSQSSDGYALAATLQLAKKLNMQRYYTDTAGFALKCEICKKALKGEKEAQAHAKATGHAQFGEF